MKKSVDITILLDRSGSMQTIKNATINGFNAFIEEQKKGKGKAFLTLAQFDHEYQILYKATNIKKVLPLNDETYIPRGLTALLDAVGKTIKKTRKRIDSLDKKDLPENVMIVILTDGYENNSRKYDRKKIFEMIEKMKTKFKWEFIFLGANQDAIHEAHLYNIDEKCAMTFAADRIGASDAFADLSRNISFCREEGGDFEFTEEQKEKQKREN